MVAQRGKNQDEFTIKPEVLDNFISLALLSPSLSGRFNLHLLVSPLQLGLNPHQWPPLRDCRPATQCDPLSCFLGPLQMFQTNMTWEWGSLPHYQFGRQHGMQTWLFLELGSVF